MDDPCDSTLNLVLVARWADIPTNEMSRWARVWLKGTDFEY